MNQYLNYIPQNAIGYCQELSQLYPFTFILKKDRSTKLGDFRHIKGSNQFVISVNNNLNQYQFLLTFIHELAHLKVAKELPRSVKAHGKEWKQAFQYLLEPLLSSDVFPEPLLSVLIQHMGNPKAAAGSDPKLWLALKNFNQSENDCTLNDLEDGSTFTFRKKQFTRLEKRRTRILCREVKSKKLYLIPGIADVEIIGS
jgi:SprT protein